MQVICKISISLLIYIAYRWVRYISTSSIILNKYLNTRGKLLHKKFIKLMSQLQPNFFVIIRILKVMCKMYFLVSG
jgi:hypothetical protein